MHIILSLFFSLLFAALSAYVAAKRQRRAILWLLLGLLGGVCALLVVLILPVAKEPAEEDALSNWINKKDKRPPPLSSYTPHDSKQWYYVDQERKALGPIELQKLQDLYAEGVIQDDTLVWYEGLGNWHRLKELEGVIP